MYLTLIMGINGDYLMYTLGKLGFMSCDYDRLY